MKYLLSLLAVIVFFTGCNTDAAMASSNLSKAADMFELERRIVFYNGINGEYILTIEGKCSIEPTNRKLAVTCKIAPNEFKKHYLGLSDNVTYFSQQMDLADVSVYHNRIIFKPQSLLNDWDFRGSTEAITELTPDNKDK